jgi:alcohol dehydrogenase class IV
MTVVALISTGMLISHAVAAAEPVYSVVSPLGDVTVEMIEMGARLDTLSNKTVCMVSNNAFKVNVTMPAVAKALQERYPGLKIVPYDDLPRAPNVDNMSAMPAAYKSKGCDAVISGNGG